MEFVLPPVREGTYIICKRRYSMRICFCAFTALACAGALFASVSAAIADPVLDRFHALDGNGDGQVSWEEFHAVSPNISRKGFDMMDSDGSGSLCESEWAGFMSNHGMEVPASMKSMTMPARDAVPPASPRAEEPARPDASGPVIMPPSSPASPAAPSAPLILPPEE